jgi:Ca2+/Na+ antiporter
MVVFMITGEQVEWWEGLIMTLCYGLYILFMVFNAKIFAKCKPKDKVHIIDAEKLEEIEKGIEKMTEDHQAKVKAAEQAIDKEQVSLTNEEATPTGDAEEEDDENKWAWPDNLPDRVWFILAFIYQCLFTVTIPPCEDDKWKKWYIVSFINSIIWIGALCLGMVFFATKIGCILTISPPVMGIVVLAVGTSVPDALGSMIVARNGEADMAIANAVGSNVFDILLGLGIPWFLNEFVHGTVVKTDLGGIGIAIGILYATVLIFVGTIVLNKFQMNSNIGKVFLATYVLYIAYTLMAEYCLIPVNKGC